ncbi:hypothetical protein AAY72_06070 [Alishewanella sp. WH16-1]|nr:hypothetical protein AAY72_06070 [Alishewanella sp. WH16-1]
MLAKLILCYLRPVLRPFFMSEVWDWQRPLPRAALINLLQTYTDSGIMAVVCYFAKLFTDKAIHSCNTCYSDVRPVVQTYVTTCF